MTSEPASRILFVPRHHANRDRLTRTGTCLFVWATFSLGALAQGAGPLLVPRGDTASFDGECTDYDDGVLETFADAGGATGQVRLKHDDDFLWVCVTGAPGNNEARTASLFLDPRADGGPVPTPDDAGLEVRVAGGARTSLRGDGEGWVPGPGLDPHWTALAIASRTSDSVEYAVSIPGLQAGACGAPLGLAFAHAGVNAVGDDHPWPETAAPEQPESWRIVELHSPPCSCGGTFRVLADAELREDDPDASLGLLPDFFVAPASPEQRGLLTFDLRPSIPPGATVTRALLELPLLETSGALPYTLRAHRIDAAWDEAAVSWNTQPALGPPYAEATFDARSGILSFDITALARGWATRSIREQSLAVTTPTPGTSLRFASRETVAVFGPPRIVVSCAPPTRDDPPDLSGREAGQQADLSRLASSSAEPLRFRPEEFGGGVRSASFSLPIPTPLARDGATRARWFLGEYRGLLRTPDPTTEWQLERRSDDDLHLFFRQRVHGIPVFPAQLAVHLDERHVIGLSGRYVPDIPRDPDPRLPAVQAEAIAREGGGGRPIGLTQLTYLNRGLLGEDDHETHLTWAVELPTETVYVDADSGAVLERLAKAYDVTKRWVFDVDNGGPYFLTGKCWGSDWHLWFNENGVLPFAQPDAEGWVAYDGLKKTFFWWLWMLGRNSWSGFGSPILMPIHAGTSQSWTDAGFGFPNAVYWCLCDTIQFSDGEAVDDVTGHEFAHGVTYFTAGLAYKNQPGALNESFSDVFGVFVDPEDWTMGEDTSGGAIRDLSNPGAFGQPSTLAGYNDKLDFDNDGKPDDNGGVHRNSGIPNKAAYLVNVGDFFGGIDVQGIGPYKTRHLWYRMLNGYLTRGSKFLDAREASLKAAREFVKKKQYGFTNFNVCSAQNAWAAVGVGSADTDCDGLDDEFDPDNDGDGWPDTQDNCPGVFNVGQGNVDKDSLGDACDGDIDNDGVANETDNCPYVSNSWQGNKYGGPKGDACDDTDGDKVVDQYDNCPLVSNSKQENTDHDYYGDACDTDADGDGLPNDVDNCPYHKNPDQANDDGDGWGDACDLCRGFLDPDNGDLDGDGTGNPCDGDVDGDGVLNDDDNCPLVANAAQTDTDGNDVGLACDEDEQSAFLQQAVGGLTVPVGFNLDVSPALFPLPISPVGAVEELPAGTVVEVSVDLPIPYFAAIVGSDGRTWAKTGPVQGFQTMSFPPPAFGATFVSPNPIKNSGVFPSTLLTPPPDQLRFALLVEPQDPVSPGEVFDLYLRYAGGAAPERIAQIVSDSCTGGAPGDGIVQPGEDAALAVVLGQEDSLPTTGLSARLSTTTPGITVTRSKASFPDLPAIGGTRSAPPHFAFNAGEDVPCGTTIDFDLEVSTGATSVVRRFTHTLGRTLSAESGDTPRTIPDGSVATSSIVVGHSGIVADVDVTVFLTHPNVGELELTLISPGGVRVPLLVAVGSGPDLEGTTFDDEAARTLTGFAPPAPYRLQPVSALSAVDGGGVTGAWSLEVIDTVRGGPSGSLERWSLAIELDRESCAPCAATLPGEPTGLHWSSTHALGWDPAPRAGWYNLYEGAAEDLPALLSAAPDACRKWFGEATSTGEALFETPLPGTLRWYLVLAANGAGEGPAGEGSSGPRMLEGAGDCP